MEKAERRRLLDSHSSLSQLTGGSVGDQGLKDVTDRGLARAATTDVHRDQTVPELVVDETRRHSFLTATCLLLLALGVAVGMCMERWSFITSLYVIVQIITTVGYGDVTVKSSTMQIFMAVYVLCSLLLIANLLNHLSNKIIACHSAALRERLERLEFMSPGPPRVRSEVRTVLVASAFFAASILSGMLFFLLVVCPAASSDSCDDSSYDSCLDTGGKTLNWANAFYMSVITVTTVGFGDYTPKSWYGQLFAIFWMLGGVAATGFFLSALSSLIADYREDDDKELEDASMIHEALFRTMDADGNGFLTKSEYARYVLVKHGLIARDILDDIDRKFDYMDADGTGQVTWAMVQAAARRCSGLPSETEVPVSQRATDVEVGAVGDDFNGVGGTPPQGRSGSALLGGA